MTCHQSFSRKKLLGYKHKSHVTNHVTKSPKKLVTCQVTCLFFEGSMSLVYRLPSLTEILKEMKESQRSRAGRHGQPNHQQE